MRNPSQRLADLRAQRASILTGIKRLREIAARRGVDVLRAATRESLDYAERRTRDALAAMPDGESTAEDFVEGRDGEIPLRVHATVSGESLELDFEGTADAGQGQPQLPALGDQGRQLLRGSRGLRSRRAPLGRAPGGRSRSARPRDRC